MTEERETAESAQTPAAAREVGQSLKATQQLLAHGRHLLQQPEIQQ
jgi:hypothetical protein